MKDKMKLTICRFSCLWLLVFVLFPLTGAEAAEDIMIDAYSARNYVLLRWYPQTIELYRKCAKEGFIVERRVVGERAWEQLEIVRPGSYNDFIEWSKKEDKALLVNYIVHKDEMLAHAKDFVNQADSLKTIDMDEFEKPDEQSMLYAMGLIACEFSADLAKLAALNYLDERVQTQQLYEYRVVPAAKMKSVTSAIVKVNTGQQTKFAKPNTLEIKQSKKNLQMQWSVAGLQKDYSGYRVERSRDGKNFVAVSDDPILHMVTDEKSKNTCMFNDTLPDCGRDYYYRYCGLNRFGLKGPYSNVVKVRCEDDFLVDIDVERVTIDKEGAHLKWSVRNPLNQAIKGFYVERIEKYEPDENGRAPFVRLNNGKLLPPTTTAYTDKKPLETNYYQVVAIGNAEGQQARSFVTNANKLDSVPPLPPVGLKGSIDSSGVVTLTWLPNTEPDIMAYRVFFSNTLDGKYIAASDTFLLTPYFTDTLFLGSLTNDIYYKVLAIDNNYNQGKLSEPLKLLKPDTIAPAKVLFEQIVQRKEDYAIDIDWINSPSNDVVRLDLYQRIGDKGQFVLLKKWENEPIPEHYTDTTDFSDKMVYYALDCYDYSGNHTLTESVPVYARERKKVCAKNLKVEADYLKGGIRLQWQKCGCQLDNIRIYRTDDGEQALLQTIGGLERSYFDATVKKGHTYKYVVKPMLPTSFTKSVSSDEIKF